jgi:putative solute:sodium symporter small subunit
MLERTERRPYWRATKWSMAATLVPLLLVTILLPIFADKLNSNPFLGFPLGYFMCAHGIFVLSLAAVAAFVSRQHAIDQLHGAQEDT